MKDSRLNLVIPDQVFVTSRVNQRIATFQRDLEGDSLAFIHGLGESKQDFVEAWDSEPLEGLPLLAFDLMGFGDSQKPNDEKYSLDLHASICADVIQRLNHDKVDLVAHSVGGAVAIKLAEIAPNLLRSLVLIEGNLIPDDCRLVSAQTAAVSFSTYVETLWPERRARLLQNRGDATCHDKMLPRAFYETACSVVEACKGGDLMRQFLSMQIPTAYMYGMRQPPESTINSLVGVRTLGISESGHSPMRENPQEFFCKLSSLIRDESWRCSDSS